MKEMNKVRILEKKAICSVLNELSILTKLNHAFIVNMKYAFQTKENLYIVLDYLSGGDLRFNMNNHSFSEKESKFILSCILVGLEYIHDNKIVHRDIKPENIIIDKKGYAYITDFGISKYLSELYNVNADCSGTVGYIPPEVLSKKCFSYSIDYFPLGVILYEFIFGKKPFEGKTNNQITNEVLTKEIIIDKDNIPKGWSKESVDLVNMLLKKKPNERIGFEDGIKEIKKHNFFEEIDWNALLNKTLKPIYIPIQGEKIEKWKGRKAEAMDPLQYKSLLNKINKKNNFEKFYYENREYKIKETRGSYLKQQNDILVENCSLLTQNSKF